MVTTVQRTKITHALGRFSELFFSSAEIGQNRPAMCLWNIDVDEKLKMDRRHCCACLCLVILERIGSEFHP